MREWYLETWLWAATGTFLGTLIRRLIRHWKQHESITVKSFVFWVLIAASIYPLLYLAHVYFQGSRGRGWAAKWLADLPWYLDPWVFLSTTIFAIVLILQWLLQWRRKGITVKSFVFWVLIAASIYPVMCYLHLHP